MPGDVVYSKIYWGNKDFIVKTVVKGEYDRETWNSYYLRLIMRKIT